MRVETFLFTCGDLICSSICQLEVADSDRHTITKSLKTWENTLEVYRQTSAQEYAAHKKNFCSNDGTLILFLTHSLNLGEQTIAMASGSIIW